MLPLLHLMIQCLGFPLSSSHCRRGAAPRYSAGTPRVCSWLPWSGSHWCWGPPLAVPELTLAPMLWSSALPHAPPALLSPRQRSQTSRLGFCQQQGMAVSGCCSWARPCRWDCAGTAEPLLLPRQDRVHPHTPLAQRAHLESSPIVRYRMAINIE